MRSPLSTSLDEALHDASEKMLRFNIRRLPVMERENPRTVVGCLFGDYGLLEFENCTTSMCVSRGGWRDFGEVRVEIVYRGRAARDLAPQNHENHHHEGHEGSRRKPDSFLSSGVLPSCAFVSLVVDAFGLRPNFQDRGWGVHTEDAQR